MKIFRKASEFEEAKLDLPSKVMDRLIFHIEIAEGDYPQNKKSCVILLDSEVELQTVFDLFPCLKSVAAKMDDTIECADGSRFRNILYLTERNHAEVSVFWRENER